MARDPTFRRTTDRQSTERFEQHPRFARLLSDHGLTCAEALVASRDGTPLRRLGHRENWRLDLSDQAGRITTFYLKKHWQTHWAGRLGDWIGASLAARSPARQEARRVAQLEAIGIPTMTVAAWAERRRPGGTLISALLTEDLAGFQQLDLFLTARFEIHGDPALRRLIAECAVLAGRFHRAGFNHRDFYTCHFFIMEDENRSGRFLVRLIDLQRLQQWPRPLRARWIVKDLSQLAYSTPAALVSPTDRMRFFKTYLRTNRLDARAKRLARAVLRREKALRRKHGPYRAEWETFSRNLQDRQ